MKSTNIFPIKDSDFLSAVLLTAIVFFAIATPTSAAATSVDFDSISYAYNGFPARITVDDPDAKDAGTVQVTVTTTRPEVGVIDSITLDLTETEEPGIFRNTWLIFMNNNNLFEEGSTITVSYNNLSEAGLGPIETFVSSIFPPDFGDSNREIFEPFFLTETTTPGEFKAQLTLTSIVSTTDAALEAVGGDYCYTSWL